MVHLALLAAQEVQEVADLLEVQELVVHLAVLVLLAAQEVQEVVDLLEVQELVVHLAVLALLAAQEVQEVVDLLEVQEALELQELQVWVVHIHCMKLILKYHMDLY